MKEVNSGIELEKFLDALTQRKAKPDDWVQMSLRALHEIIETHRQQERERIISLPKYDLSKRGVDGELYIKVEDIKTLN